ncbi:MAG: dual specificity protein phosphatase family protein [Anaerolineales bacterium]|nr:dual specificity protein phosphatase family protein [Anaerolineales bacterium]
MKPTQLPIPESYWVQPGRFLAGEYPGAYEAEATRRRMDAFLEAGINSFFDLTQAHERVPYESILKEQARAYDIAAHYQRFAIPDHRVPSSATMHAILNAMDEALHNGQNIYAHCWGGIGRTGLAVACHLVQHGLKNEQALERLNEMYRTRPANPSYPRSPETQEQIDFVLNWREIPSATHASQQTFCEG